MTNMERDKVKAWGGSIFIHSVIILVLLLMRASMDTELPEFVQMSWGAPSSPVPLRIEAGEEGEPPVTRRAEPEPPGLPVTLPERRHPVPDEEVVRVPDLDKMKAEQQVTEGVERRMTEIDERRDRDAAAVFGERERFRPAAPENLSGDLPISAGSPSEPVSEREVGYALEWVGDITRKKVSGMLPEYPPGVNVEAIIRLRAIVMPDGSVKSVHPVVRGNVRLEEAAAQSVRYWEFEPLGRNHPQVDQECYITFHFLLR